MVEEIEVEEGEGEEGGVVGKVEVAVEDSNEGLGTVEKSACRIEVSALLRLINCIQRCLSNDISLLTL